MELAMYLAALCGMVGALKGNRTAWALLGSFGVCLAAQEAGMPFNFMFWMLVDALVVLAIIRPNMTHWDTAVLALFIPAWALYLAPPDTLYWGVSLIVIAQFLLTFPLPQLWRASDPVFRRFGGSNRELMVAHVG